MYTPVADDNTAVGIILAGDQLGRADRTKHANMAVPVCLVGPSSDKDPGTTLRVTADRAGVDNEIADTVLPRLKLAEEATRVAQSKVLTAHTTACTVNLLDRRFT